VVMYMTQEIKSVIKKEFQVEIQGHDLDSIKFNLVEKINELILSDFQKLVNILYRIDVSEAKLKQLLNEPAEQDAATIIASLIIERQQEKIRSRKQFGKQDSTVHDEEIW